MIGEAIRSLCVTVGFFHWRTEYGSRATRVWPGLDPGRTPEGAQGWEDPASASGAHLTLDKMILADAAWGG